MTRRILLVSPDERLEQQHEPFRRHDDLLSPTHGPANREAPSLMLEVVRAGEILSQDLLHRFQVDPLVIAGIRTQEMPGPSISVRPVGTLNPLWWVRVQHRVMVFRATVDPADALSSHAVDGRMFRSETLLAKSLPPGDLSPVAAIDRPGHAILD